MKEGSGIRVHKPKAWTMDDIRQRCDEIGECLIWRLSVDECGRPVARIGDQSLSVRKYVYELEGKTIRAHHFAIPRCGDKRCLSHLACVPRSTINRESRQRSLMIPANWYEHQQRPSRAKLTPALAAEIRASDESIEVLADRLGVKKRSIKRVKAQETWKPAPVANSVFSLASVMGVA